MNKKILILFILGFIFFILKFEFAAAAYNADVYFTVPNTVYSTQERIELKGYVYQANFTSNTSSNSSVIISNASINLTIKNSNASVLSNYTLTTDSNGAFYSKSNFYSSATEILAPSTAGTYDIRAEYKDPENTTWFSEVEIAVINQSIDLLSVSPNKATYNPSENIVAIVEATRLIGDKILYISNVSINGTLRNSTKTILQTFSCTTGSSGKCSVILTGQSTNGEYILEVSDFKAFSSLSVIPFSYNLYMKDELGQSYKNIFATSEQARVEVQVTGASSSDVYTFSGYIRDSDGNVVKIISSTILNSNNSFTNSYLFTLDALSFSYGSYSAYITVTKSGDGSISSSTSFQVKDWIMALSKKTTGSGFEYEYSSFLNKTLKMEVYPTYRSNGSVVEGINSTSFSVDLKDNLNNIFSSANATWNASCGTQGCYEFSFTSPVNPGQYTLYVTLSYSGAVQTENRVISIISGVMSAQSTNKDGDIKELFGTTEYAYISLSAYNSTSAGFNLTDAEVFIVNYMNGTEFSYTQVNNFDLVNMSNTNYEWAWNSTLQRIKMDIPKIGGVYDILLFGNNKTIGGNAKFIVNPYDVCAVPKDTLGQAGGSTGYYYVWQFKTADTVYFEIKLIQANNPLGKASISNFSSGNGTGMGSACSINTQTQQTVSNATLTVIEVKNTESGATQLINTSASICQASDNSGGYSCTVKPLSKWEGGQNIVKFNIAGQDGTASVAYSRFEARAFYLYGWSQVWQNNPSSNVALSVQLYEAGKGWWGGGGSSGGLSGTITVKKIEYQGRDGEWIWPPVDSGYNVTNLNSSSITNGYNYNAVSLPASNMPGGIWKTGYYRAVLQATTANGDTDYGYAWFGVKLWDVYGQPIECTSTGCNYKSYFNSRENISLYIKISKAGNYNYNDYGGQDIYGNVSIGIKSVQDCRKWPCKELNSSDFSANTINVNASSPWYWNGNNINQSRYILQINTTRGTWGTGWYSVVLNVNGTDTGSAWFNTIAFYVETQPTDANGSNYKYSIRGNQRMYFNITTTQNYKWGGSYYNGSSWIYSRYNESDYVNTTIDDAVLRTWDQQTFQNKEYNYPENINITPLIINANGLINVSYLNGSWPTGYYWGELVMRNSANETSTGWLWFEVKPFRIQIDTAGSYEIDSDQCINTSLNIYDPDWYSSTPLWGNYSIISVYEDVWDGYGASRTNYTNYTSGSFNATANITFCPNNGQWGSGSWGGYHYLNILVKDNIINDTQVGWLSFRTVPFRISWSGTGGNKLTNANIDVTASLTKASTGANATGNLTSLYQWRYDNYQSTREEYVFKVGDCYSNVSRQCTVNGTQNVTIYAPSQGWRTGYNYLYAEWTKTNDASVTLQDWSGIYFEGRTAYNGWFDNNDENGYWKYYFTNNENLTIKLSVRDNNYNSVDVNITRVQYALSDASCYDEWCRVYTDAVYSPTSTSSGSAVLKIKVPTSGWTKGSYYIKATVSGSGGITAITGGNVRVKDFVAPNVTISIPVNNGTYNNSISFSAATTKNAQCSINIINYDNFYNWYCGGWNSTNSTNSSVSNQTIGACNVTKYGYSGGTYYTEYLSGNYHSTYDGNTWRDYYNYPALATFMTTGGTAHTYTLNITNWTTQNYGLQIWCYDEDSNYASAMAAFKVNGSASNSTQNDTTPPNVVINSPINRNYSASSVTFNFTLNENGTCRYTLNNGATNYSMSTIDNRNFNATNSSVLDGDYRVYAYCNDSSGNINNTAYVNFTIDTVYPIISYGAVTANNYANLSQNWIYVNITFTEINFANITFLLRNSTGEVNRTVYTTAVYYINWTSLPYTNYSYNVSIYDSAGNFNATAIRYINLSAG